MLGASLGRGRNAIIPQPRPEEDAQQFVRENVKDQKKKKIQHLDSELQVNALSTDFKSGNIDWKEKKTNKKNKLYIPKHV